MSAEDFFDDLISGDVGVFYDKTDYGERTLKLGVLVVTDEASDKDGANFLAELENLLKKYAI